MATQAFTTTGSQNWNWPAGVTSATAEAVGGGGGGGIASGNPATGGGGRGGNYAAATLTKGAESLLVVVVGTGGAIASAGAASTVTQNSVLKVAALGGGGGATQATSSANGAGATVAGAGTATGTTLFTGGNGGTGNFTSGTQGSGAGGGAAGPTANGGAASVNVAGTANAVAWADGLVHSGAGAAGVGNGTPGITGPIYGGGASGGKASTGADQNGGVGAQGYVLISWVAPDQAVTGVTRAAAAVLNAPVVKLTQFVTGVHRATTQVLNVPVVAILGQLVIPVQTFTAADTTPLPTPPWTMMRGAIEITGNAATGVTSGAHNQARWTANVFALNHYAECDVFPTGTGAQNCGPAVNADTDGTCYLLWVWINSGVVEMRFNRMSAGGGFTAISGFATIALGDRIRAERVGTMLRGYRNGTMVLEVFDPVLGGGGGGFDLYGAGAQIDNWSGGDVVATLWAVTGGSITAGSLTRTPIITTGLIPPLDIPIQDFTGSNNAPLPDPPWSVTRGAFVIFSNAATGSGPSDRLNIAIYNAATFSPTNHYAECDILMGAAFMGVGPSVNLDFSNNGYWLVASHDSGALEIQRMDAGGNAVIAGSISSTATSGDHLRLERAGNDLIGYRNGVAVCFATDTTYLANTRTGMTTYLNAQMDNWTAGNITGGGPSDQSVTGAHRASTVSINTPSITLQHQSVTTATVRSTVRFPEALLFESAYGSDTALGLNAYSPGNNLSQTISGHTGTLTSVSLCMSRDPNTSVEFPAEELYLEIHESTLTGPLLATSQRIFGATLPTPSGPNNNFAWVNFSLLNEVPLFVGTTYWIELFLTRTYQSLTDGRYLLRLVKTNPYPGGEVRSESGSILNPSWDIDFRLYTTGPSHTIVPVAPGGAQSVTTAHRLSTAVLNPLAVSGGTLTILLPTIAGSAGDLLQEDGNDLLLEDGSYLLLEGGTGLAQTFAPGVAQTGASQAVTGAALVSTVVVRVPSVTTGPVTITGATIATAIAVTAPAITVGPVTVTGVYRATTIQVFAPTTTGLLTGATIVSGSGAFPPSVAQVVTTAHRATTVQTFAPTLTQSVTTAFRASTAQVFPATVAAGPVSITTSTRPTTVQLNAPTVAPGPVGITGATIASAVQCFAAAVTTGAVTVVGATIAATLVLFAPALTSVAPGGIGAGTVASEVVVNPPSLVGGLVTIFVQHIASTGVTRPPSVTVGATSVGGATLPPTSVLRAPTVIVGAVDIVGVSRPSTAQLNAPTVTALLTGATIPSGSGLFPPVLLVVQAVTTAHRASTLALNAPSVTVGPVGVTTPFRLTTAVLNPPAIASAVPGVVGAGTIPSFIFMNAPTVQPGSVTILGATRATGLVAFPPALTAIPALPVGTTPVGSTAQLFPPAALARLDGTFIASTAHLNPPSVLTTVGIVIPFLSSTTQTYAPLVAHGLQIAGETIASTAELFPPTLEAEIWTGALPPAIASGVTVRQRVVASAVTSAVSLTGMCVVRQAVRATALSCTQSVMSDGTTVRVRQLVTSTDIEGWRP